MPDDALERLEKLAGQSCWSTTEAEFALQRLPDLIAKVREQAVEIVRLESELEGAKLATDQLIECHEERVAALRARAETAEQERDALQVVSDARGRMVNDQIAELAALRAERDRVRDKLEAEVFYKAWVSTPEWEAFAMKCKLCNGIRAHAPACLLAEKEPDHGR